MEPSIPIINHAIAVFDAVRLENKLPLQPFNLVTVFLHSFGKNIILHGVLHQRLKNTY